MTTELEEWAGEWAGRLLSPRPRSDDDTLARKKRALGRYLQPFVLTARHSKRYPPPLTTTHTHTH